MIPISLTIEGLYSYRQRTRIDFERLTQDQVFGIFGPVGSGKSSILEAITFALYGQTERMDSRGRNYNMMNLRSDELWIEFIFELIVGEGRKRFRFTVASRRNSKNFSDVQAYKRTAYEWVTEEEKGAWTPLESNDAGKILGLTYKNFIKTIIVPQGKFKEFLHATLTQKERGELLEELFDLQRFDLAGPTKLLLDQARNDFAALEGQLKEVPEVDPAAIEAQAKALEALQKQILELGEQLERQRKQIAEMEEVRDLENEWEATRMLLEGTEEELPKYEKREQELRRYQEAEKQFRDLLRMERELKVKLERGREAQARLGQEKQDKEKERESAAEKLEALTGPYERRAEWEQKAREMEQMAEMVTLQADLGARKGRRMQFEASQQELEQSLHAGVALLANIDRDIDRFQSDLDQGEDLDQLLDWFRQQSRLKEQVGDAQHAQAERQQALSSQQSVLTEILEGHAVLAGARDPDQASAQLRSALQNAEAEESALAAQIQHLQFQVGLGEYAAQLSEGDPCPLCGATHHPAPYEAARNDQQILELEAQKRQSRESQRQWIGLREQVTQAFREHDRLKEAFRQATTSLNQQQTSLQEYRETFPSRIYGPDEDERVAKAVEVMRGERKKLEERYNDRRRQEQGMANMRAELQQLKAAQQKEQDEITRIEARFEALGQQLSQFRFADYADHTAAQLRVRAGEFQQEQQRLESAYREARARLERAQAESLALDKKVEVNLAMLNQSLEQNQTTQDAIAKRLESSGFRGRSEVIALLNQNLDTEAEEEAIRQFREDLQVQRSEKERLLKKLDGRSFDKEAHSALLEAKKVGQVQQEAWNRELGSQKNQLQQLKQALEKRLLLQEAHDRLRGRVQNLEQIAKMFKAKGFVEFVSSQLLHELARRANQRFMALTQNQLSLELNEQNQFHVRDVLNDGRYRSIKTLSGGQTFQAALSLALSLADTIQSRLGSRHNFFFLDEGFGTLDKHSLGIVFDALQQLRREKRVVGVISHVEELQQEIGVSLRVRMDKARGSVVKGSWEG